MGKLCNFRLFVGKFIFHFFFFYLPTFESMCHCCCYCSHFSSCGERWKRAFFERRVRVRWGWLLMMRFGNPLPYVEDWQVGPRELNDLWIGFYAGWVVCVVLPSPDEHHNNTTVIDDTAWRTPYLYGEVDDELEIAFSVVTHSIHSITFTRMLYSWRNGGDTVGIWLPMDMIDARCYNQQWRKWVSGLTLGFRFSTWLCGRKHSKVDRAVIKIKIIVRNFKHLSSFRKCVSW